MGRTLSWWLLVGTFFGLAFAFMYAMAMNRQFADVAAYGLLAGAAAALLAAATSR